MNILFITISSKKKGDSEDVIVIAGFVVKFSFTVMV